MTTRPMVEVLDQDDQQHVSDCAARWPEPNGWDQLYDDDDEDTT